jgi:hypothetical protein
MSDVDGSVPDTSQESQMYKNLHHKSKESVNCDPVNHGTDEQIQLKHK